MHFHFRAHTLLRGIKLVLHLSDNLFQNILQGDDTSRLTVFVDDHGEMCLLALHQGHEFGDRCRLWYSQDRSEDALDGKRFV